MIKCTVKVDAKQFLWLLNRALNTLEPADWPQWAEDLAGGSPVPWNGNGGVSQGVLPTDSLEVVVYREET